MRIFLSRTTSNILLYVDLSSRKDLGHMEDSGRQKTQRDGWKQEDRAAAEGEGGGREFGMV